MIPENFSSSSLKELLEKMIDYRGQSVPKADCGIPLITARNVKFGFLDFTDQEFVDEDEFQSWMSRGIPKSGDILFTTEAPLGNVSMYPSKGIYAIGQRIITLRVKPDILNPVYLKNFLLSVVGQERIRIRSSGSTATGIRSSELKKVLIDFPPLLEQCRIAEMLGVWDESIDLLEKLIGRVRSRKQGLMQQLLTGKKRFKEFGLPVISEDSIPDTWRKVTLRETAAKEKYSFTGGPFGSNLKAEHYTEEGVRIIQLQNIGDGHFNDKYKIFTTEEKADELISCNIYPGDIILSKMGDPVARACFIPDSAPRFLMASDGIRLKVNTSEFDPFFLLQQINSPIFRKIAISHSTGSTRQRIGLDILRDLPILTPPLPEQEKIAAVLSAADEEISTLEKQLAAYKQQKLGLMQQLLTGKIRVGMI
jgi:type I restriction enzyme, S subunit